MKALPKELIAEIARLEPALKVIGHDTLTFGVQRDVLHMAAKVRALSYRMPLFVRTGNRVITYSISGWHGAM